MRAGIGDGEVPNGDIIATPVKPRTRKQKTSTVTMAIFTSKASIFLPRYSGVRPTIKPAMKTERTMKTMMPYIPAPTPPKITSPIMMLTKRHHSAEWGERVVHAIHRAATGIRGGRCEERCRRDPKANFLPFHIAAGLRGAGVLVDAMQQRIAAGLRRISDGDTGEERKAIAAQTAQPCRCEPVIRPSV